MTTTVETHIENDKNDRNKRLRNTGNNSELEKFKRRLIRAVARMLVHEKRDEIEVWDGLKQETGCNCKLLWDRMYALTMKKIKRLLEAQDRNDLLPKPARMSITDWLLFDQVIVHEDIDVIGLTETSNVDSPILVDLYSLVEKYNIEFNAGDKLADAWTQLTVEYNKDNRQCSPMLLQRRWYQLKLATRARFYKFWSMYKGQLKSLSLAKPYTPTPLQIDIAKRHKSIVVSQFVPWDELIEHKLVILPDEFEPKHLRQTSDNTPEVMCLESNVETIELDLDSDTEIEYRKDEDKKKEESTAVTIKEEPKDFDETNLEENVLYQNRQEKLSHFAEAVMEATALELNEMELEDDINGFIGSEPGGTTPPNANISVEDNNKVSDINEISLKEKNAVCEDVCSTNNATANDDDVIPVEEQPDEHKLVSDETINEEDVDLEHGIAKTTNESETMLPKITSIFGGIDVSNETLSKIGMLTAEITKNKAIIEKDDNIARKTNTEDATIELSSDEKDDTSDSIPGNVKEAINNNTNINKTWFGELSDDIVFADEGIQLLDDGIACHDDEYEYKIDAIKIEKNLVDAESCVKSEITPVEDEESDDIPKVDRKLLMLPVVSTMKLDDMGILPIDLLNHVDNKTIIDMIHFKSKPILKEKDDSSTESSEEEVMEDIKKVKLSSVLLQKPRSRTYNPIQLCKNPDFNTRLKRLTVGFFSSTRNRYLLKSCNPVTIDVSKAFENKLVNGTMYLKTSENEELSKSDDSKESNTVSVIPSAMPVQSLIDNIDVKDSQENRHAEYSPIIPNPVESLGCERNKVINLPDISEIRRINQQLLTAQVTPLQFKNPSPYIPLSDVPSATIEGSRKNTVNKFVGRRVAGPASRTRVALPAVVDITKEERVNPKNNDSQALSIVKHKEPAWRTGDKIIPWKPRQIRPDIPWLVKCNSIYDSDTLLALDSLNKMLYLLSNEDHGECLIKNKKWKSKTSARAEKISSESIDHRETIGSKPKNKTLSLEMDKISIDADDNDDVQVVSESKIENSETDLKGIGVETRTDAKKKEWCCWARMMVMKKRVSPHGCAFPICKCCCKQALADFYKIQRTNPKSKCKKIRIENFVYGPSAEIIPIFQQTTEADSSSLHSEDGKQSKITNQTAVNAHVVTLNEDMECDEASSDVSCTENVNQTEDPVKSNKLATNVESEQIDNGTQTGQFDLGMEIEIESSESSKLNLESDNTDSVDTGCADLNLIAKKTPRFRLSNTNRKNFSKRNRQNRNSHLRRHSIPENQIKVTTGPTNLTDTTKLDQQEAEIPIIKVNTNPVQRTITIDHGVPNLIPISSPKPLPPAKTYVNQRLIYLNRRVESCAENPIFLGKNKILLTTAKFPPNFKGFEELQRYLKQSHGLPKGIQLILQPDGKLTYIRLPRTVINETFTEVLPHLISVFQQQIDEYVPAGVEKPNITNAENEVIDLSDDEMSKEKPVNYESSEPKDTTNEVAPVADKSLLISQESPMLEIDNVDFTQNDEIGLKQNCGIDSVQNENADVNQNDYSEGKQVDNVEAAQNDSLNTNALQLEDDLTSKNSTNTPNPENIIQPVENSISTDTTKTAITPSTEITTEETNVTSPQDPEILSSQNIEKEVNEPVIGKTKNILSDLMAMSGIGPIDISPTPQPMPTTPITPNISVPLQMKNVLAPSVSDQNQPLLNIDVLNNANIASDQSLLLQSLTAITSLSELKYACAQNGTFFKLDFDTGLLVPINVCMKKLNETSQLRHNLPKYSGSPSKPVIDLTDDDICEVTEPIQEKGKLLLKINQNTNESEIQNNKEIVKPLKLFKSTRAFFHTTRKIVKINAAGDTRELDSNMTLTVENQYENTNVVEGTINNVGNTKKAGAVKPLKLFKSTANQPNILRRKLKEIEKRISDAMTAQDLIRRKLKRKQELRQNSMYDDDNEEDLNIGDKSGTDCSSDEEPLAKIAKKMRTAEKENNELYEEKNKKPDEQEKQDIAMDSEVTPTDEAKDGELVSESDLMVPVEDDITLEVLDEGTLNADDEDCILGV